MVINAAIRDWECGCGRPTSAITLASRCYLMLSGMSMLDKVGRLELSHLLLGSFRLGKLRLEVPDLGGLLLIGVHQLRCRLMGRGLKALPLMKLLVEVALWTWLLIHDLKAVNAVSIQRQSVGGRILVKIFASTDTSISKLAQVPETLLPF